MISTDQIIDYIKYHVIGRPDLTINPHTPLISSGLIDSFAIADILMGIEEILHISIPPGAVQAQDVETVQLLLAAVQRFVPPKIGISDQ